MSKIYEAYRMRVRDNPDLAIEFGLAGSITLFSAPSGPQLDDFSQLANRLLSLRLEGQGAVIGFSATTSGEGTSFVSYNTAVILAQVYKQKVAWVDGNFLAPQKKLGGDYPVTLSLLLQSPDSVKDIRVTQNPMLVGAGANLMGARGLMASDRFASLLEDLGRAFDFVLLDLPPVLGHSDTAMMASNTDGLLLVIQQRNLKWEIVEHGLQMLRDKNVRILGSVLNRRRYELPKIIYDRL